MRVLLTALLLLLTALAGCSDAPDEDGADPADSGDEANSGNSENSEEDAAPVPDLNDPVEQDWFFTSSRGLSTDSQTAGSFTLTGGYSTFAQTLTGNSDAAFSALQSDAFDEPTLLLPETVTYELHYQVSEPSIHDSQFGYIVWIGTTQSMPVAAFIPGSGGPLLPGETYSDTITVDWGSRLPLLIEPGESLQSIVAITASPASDGSGITILVGGETASKVTYTTQSFNIDPLDVANTPTEETFTGTLQGIDPINCIVQEGVTHMSHEIQVLDDISYLRIETSGTDATGGGDLDFDLYDGNSILGGGHTPTANEGLLFAGPAIDDIAGKTLRIQAQVCTAQQMNYSIDVTQA